MINFTVGPVQSGETVREIGKEQVPYFRTPEFSEIMLENERLMCRFTGAPEGSRAVFLTGSGTASTVIYMPLTGRKRWQISFSKRATGGRFPRQKNKRSIPLIKSTIQSLI